jgi:prepilin-type N-terminal cleavage/methylation domain-containing protein
MVLVIIFKAAGRIISGEEMKVTIMDNSRGFTLLELLIAMAVSSIIMAAVVMLSVGGQRAASGIEQKVYVQQDVRAALDLMASEISMASYNPNLIKSTLVWRAADCITPGVVNSQGVYINRGIPQADASNLTVEMDLTKTAANPYGNDSVLDANEIITYSYAGNQITRNVSCSGAQPFIGDANVQVINDAATPVFRYFNGNNQETANLPDIRRITITLVVRSIAKDLSGQARTAAYSTSVMVRNHAIYSE